VRERKQSAGWVAKQEIWNRRARDILELRGVGERDRSRVVESGNAASDCLSRGAFGNSLDDWAVGEVLAAWPADPDPESKEGCCVLGFLRTGRANDLHESELVALLVSALRQSSMPAKALQAYLAEPCVQRLADRDMAAFLRRLADGLGARRGPSCPRPRADVDWQLVIGWAEGFPSARLGALGAAEAQRADRVPLCLLSAPLIVRIIGAPSAALVRKRISKLRLLRPEDGDEMREFPSDRERAEFEIRMGALDRENRLLISAWFAGAKGCRGTYGGNLLTDEAEPAGDLPLCLFSTELIRRIIGADSAPYVAKRIAAQGLTRPEGFGELEAIPPAPEHSDILKRYWAWFARSRGIS